MKQNYNSNIDIINQRYRIARKAMLTERGRTLLSFFVACFLFVNAVDYFFVKDNESMIKGSGMGSVESATAKAPAFRLYPNPLQGSKIFIEASGVGSAAGNVNAIVRNTLGREVVNARLQEGVNEIILHSSEEGFYFITITDEANNVHLSQKMLRK